MNIFKKLEKELRSLNFDIGFDFTFDNSHDSSILRSKKGIFFPPKHKELANIITIKSVSGARKAVRKIKALLRKGKYKLKQLRAALNLAGVRAKVIAKTKAKNPSVKRRLLQVSKIYLNAAKKLGKEK